MSNLDLIPDLSNHNTLTLFYKDSLKGRPIERLGKREGNWERGKEDEMEGRKKGEEKRRKGEKW